MCKIAPLLGPLRSPPNVIGSEEDRKKREYTLDLSKKALLTSAARRPTNSSLLVGSN